MTDQGQSFNVMEAIITMLAVKFLQSQKGGEYTFTQQELKNMLEAETVRLELVHPTAPQTTDIKCVIVTLEDAKRLAQTMKKVVDRTKKKGEA